MNQILFTNNNNNNNDYNRIDTKKIIKIFCIAIIIVSFIIICLKVYGGYQEHKKNAKNSIPEITLTRGGEESGEVTIKVTCKDGIEYLIYTWNNEQEVRVNLNGSTTFERIVEIPGNQMNNLKVEVNSVNSISNQKTQVFENSVIDNTKPVVEDDDITIIDKKLKIHASDDSGIKYLAYKWENEEEVIVEQTDESKEMTVEIDIQRGTYKLQIRIVDIYNNEEVLSRLVTGVNEPEISAIKYGGIVKVSVIHDMGFKKIEFIINNEKYVYDEEFSRYDQNKTTVEFDFPIKEGENIIQVNAYSMEKLSEEAEEELENYAFKRFTGKCTYEP